MALLTFHYGTMNSGKSLRLLQEVHSRDQLKMHVCVLMPRVALEAAGETNNDPSVTAHVCSRVGIQREALTFEVHTDLHTTVKGLTKVPNCVFVDEAQFMTEEHVKQLAQVVDELHIPVQCYGLRTDFAGHFFPGSEALCRLSDELTQIGGLCHCGRPARMSLRISEDGTVAVEGSQVCIGGNDRYTSVCRAHWKSRTVSAVDC